MSWFAKKPEFVIGERGIDTIEKVMLGGVEQTILIQGNDLSRPILLFLHGGPSLPLPGVSSRGQDYTVATCTRELVDHFILVFWDQRGTGKSYHRSIPQSSMRVTQFVDDTIELTDYLRTRFRRDRIFLAGHSWGSTVGLMAAAGHPDKFYSYVGISQIVSWTENDRLALPWLKANAAKRGNQKAHKELDAIGEPPFTDSFEQWGTLRKWQQRFGTLIHTDDQIKHPGLIRITLDMFRSKDYSLKDMYHTFSRGFKLVYSHEFIAELSSIHANEHAPEVHLPVTFIHGAKDNHVFGSLTEEYYKNLKTEHSKQFIWLDKSAHLFHPDDARQIEQIIIKELRHADE